MKRYEIRISDDDLLWPSLTDLLIAATATAWTEVLLLASDVSGL
jgi:hypothetical protein